VDVHSAVARVRHRATPHVLVDALAADDVTGAYDKNLQHVELARGQVQTRALDEDLPLGRRQLDMTDHHA
jgi:hypothetical protein